jgi:hypothetical protein
MHTLLNIQTLKFTIKTYIHSPLHVSVHLDHLQEAYGVPCQSYTCAELSVKYIVKSCSLLGQRVFLAVVCIECRADAICPALENNFNKTWKVFFLNCQPTMEYGELMDQSLSISYVLQFSRTAESCGIFASDVVGIPFGASISVIFFGRSGILIEMYHNYLFHTPWKLDFSSCVKQIKHSTSRGVLNSLNHGSNYNPIRFNIQ